MRNYEYITETREVERLLPYLMTKQYQTHDSETTGLCPHQNKIILYQIGDRNKQYLIDTRVASLEPLRPYFESRTLRKLFHNAKFDYKMMRGTFDISIECVRCTQLAEQVLTAGVYRFGRKKDKEDHQLSFFTEEPKEEEVNYGISLEDVLWKHLKVRIDKRLQKSFIDHTGPFSREQLEYAADDILYLEDAFKKQIEIAKPLNLIRTIELECNAVPAFGDMEFDGMVLDIHGWRKIATDNQSFQLEIQAELDEIAKQHVGEDFEGKANIMYSSCKQVLNFLNAMGLRVPVKDPITGEEITESLKKTDAKYLKRISHLPVIKALNKWRSYDTLINTFGEPFIKALNPVTGRLHPDLFQIGTATGRPAAGDSVVNPLNIPRDNRYRSCFTCEEDEVVESDDYSGCESRILAEISGDPKLIDIFRRGDDIHCAVGSELYGITVTKKGETSKYRTPAKSLNFGIAYGLGPGRLYEELNGSGFPTTREEAKRLYDKYCSTYATAVNYLRSQGRKAATNFYLANLNGRRRYWSPPDPARFPLGTRDGKYKGIMAKIERDGGNFLIQSVNADITKDAMIDTRFYIKDNKVRSKLMNAIYDELVTRTHKDDSPAFHEAKLKIMKASAEKWIKTVPMEVEGAVGRCWQK